MRTSTDRLGPLGIIQLERADDPAETPPVPVGTLTHAATFSAPTIVRDAARLREAFGFTALCRNAVDMAEKSNATQRPSGERSRD